MNIYRCWYHGTCGFAGKLDRENWLFVPDLGQADNLIHRRIGLSELVFRNRFEYEYELELQSGPRFPIVRFLMSFIFPTEQIHTTAGMLFLAQDK